MVYGGVYNVPTMLNDIETSERYCSMLVLILILFIKYIINSNLKETI